MVKKKLLALGVSAVAVTAVVGAGFAGWTFTTEAKAEKNLGINVTAAYSFGTVAFADDAPDTVVLDQSGITLDNGGTAKTDIVATWTVNTVSYTDAEADLTYAVNVYVKDGLADYVNCGTTTAEATTAKTGYTQYVLTPTTSNAESGDNTVVTMTLSNPFGYTDAKPADFDGYKAMVAAIKGVGADTVATDTEYSVAATDAPVVIEFTVTKTTD